MSKTTAHGQEKRPGITGLPAYFVAGTPERARSSRPKVGIEQLKKMFDWWEIATPTVKQSGARDVGLPASELAKEFGLAIPTNGNSFRANLQRILDDLNIGGRTMLLSLRGTEGDKFRVTPQTMVWFHPVPAIERAHSSKKQ
jgi:hypothetical protein